MISGAQLTQKRRGKYSSIANIQNKLKLAMDQRAINNQASQMMQQEIASIIELPKKQMEDVEFKKYEGKIYDEDLNQGVIKIENSTNQINFADLNLQREHRYDSNQQQGFVEKLKDKRGQVNNNHLHLPYIKSTINDQSLVKSDQSSLLSRNDSPPIIEHKTQRSVILRDVKGPLVQLKPRNVLQMLDYDSSKMNQRDYAQEKLENKLRVQKKMEQIKERLQLGQQGYQMKPSNSTNNLLYLSLNLQSQRKESLLTDDSNENPIQEPLITSPNKERRVKMIESIHQNNNSTLNQILQSNSQKISPTKRHRYSSVEISENLQESTMNKSKFKLSEMDFANQIDTLENDYELRIQIQKASKVLQFDLANDEVRQHDLKKYLDDVKNFSVQVESSGMAVICGGISTALNQISNQAVFIDLLNERVIEMADMIEGKIKHKTVFCNNKLFVLGGFNNVSMTQKSQTVHKYDLDLKKWFICNPMNFGHSGDSFFAIGNNNSTNIYAFGGCDNPDNSKILERYDSVLDVWITMSLKVPNTFFGKLNQIFYLTSPSDAVHTLIFGGSPNPNRQDKNEKILHIDQDQVTKKLVLSSLSFGNGQYTQLFKYDDNFSNQKLANASIHSQSIYFLRDGQQQQIDRIDIQNPQNQLTRLKFGMKQEMKSRILNENSQKFLSPSRNEGKSNIENIFSKMSSPKLNNLSPLQSMQFTGTDIYQSPQLLNNSKSTYLPSINSILKVGMGNQVFSFLGNNMNNKNKANLRIIKEDML
eukprot:403371477